MTRSPSPSHIDSTKKGKATYRPCSRTDSATNSNYRHTNDLLSVDPANMLNVRDLEARIREAEREELNLRNQARKIHNHRLNLTKMYKIYERQLAQLTGEAFVPGNLPPVREVSE